MKLLLVISFIAASYAAKLDRTYLPPATAGSAGGSPGSLDTPKFGATQNSQYPLGPSDAPDNTQYGRTSYDQSNATPGLNRFNKPSIDQADNGAGDFNDISSPGGSFGQTPSRTQAFGSNQPIGSTFGSNGINQPITKGFNNNVQAPNTFQQSYTPERAQAAGDRNSEILRYANENDGETFSYNFETSNGITAEESGVATNGVRAQGAFSYTGDDGNGYSITYTADENGYLPQGEHLPTPHPIPEEILRSIEKNAEAAASGTQEGAYRPEEYENENIQAYNQATNFNDGQSIRLPQDQTSYSYTRPSVQSPGQQGSAAQAGPGSLSSLNQQPGFKIQQGQTSQPPFGTTGFGTPNNGVSNNISPNNAQAGQNQENQGYNYNRPQPNIPSSTNSFGQESPRQSGSPSKSNFQNQSPLSPTFNSGLSTDSSSPPFSQLNRGSLNQIGQTNSQQGQNQGSDGYNYERPQPTQYTPSKNSFNRGTLEKSPSSATQGQNNFQYRPITLNNQQPSITSGSASPSSQLNNNQQTFGSNRPINPTNKISEPVNQFNQINQNRDNSGYNYDRPQPSQFAKPNANLFGQASFKSQPSQSQTGIPSGINTQTIGIQRPSSNVGANSDFGSKPSTQFASNRNQQSYKPTGSNNQLGQTNVQFGQDEPNKQSNGYNYDRPQLNQFNQGSIPSKPMTQEYNGQRPSNINSGSSGFKPFIQSNTNNLNRPVDSQIQPGPVSQDASQYNMPQKFGSTAPLSQNQSFSRGPAASQAPYSYDRPSSSSIANARPNFGSQRPQTQNGSPNQREYLPPNKGQGEQFGGPRQPPSFSSEEGYKY